MDEFIKLLDPSLDYISHEIIGDTIFIRVASNKEEAVWGCREIDSPTKPEERQ